ncbi:ligase-associated DNA damage response exonuclease [Labrys wisconsinensis]|uniref:ligase-associated DNA damage response exonuclease n=1 Tax=Labrys wisconsinensis TaxID=425677 RepID=UPI0027D8949D|nr:ligase-associated DNA damage response exonuclease [Labrys wisconsinensis]
MRPSDLLVPTPAGLHCPIADVHVDPMRPVARALITHGHSDHARAGHGAVLATRETLAIMAARYGEDFCGTRQVAEPGRPIDLGGVTATFHPAGHVLGSAQIAFEARGLRIVVSGDYKRAADPTCAPFEPVRCEVFISEATFALPVFRHPDADGEVAKLLRSAAMFPERAHLVGAYPLGKAQRLVALIRAGGHQAPVYLHGAMEKLTRLYEANGVALGDVRLVRDVDPKTLAGSIVLCPPGALGDLWSRKLPDPVAAYASGWMRIRARARQSGAELPLVVSDHADWPDLQRTVLETGCAELWVTHGQEEALVHWAKGQGLAARPLHLVGYGEEEEAA